VSNYYHRIQVIESGVCVLGTVHKRRPQSGKRGLSNSDKGEGFFRCGRPHFLMQKKFGFFEIYGMDLHGQGGEELNQCGHFSDK